MKLLERWDWDYPQALESMSHCQEEVLENPLKKFLLIGSHPQILTVGRRGPSTLSSSFPTHWIQRGGGVTFHYPGQLVAYPILRIGGRNPSLADLVDILFQATRKAWEHFGAEELVIKRGAHTGLWARGKKVASLGFGAHRLVTTHGLSINIKGPLPEGLLGPIHPCGLPPGDYSYLEAYSGREVPLKSFAAFFTQAFQALFSEVAK